MSAGNRVQLVGLGMRIDVPRDTGFEVFERNRELVATGRTEVMPVELAGPRREVLHLLLGGQPLAVIEPADLTAGPGHGRPEPAAADIPSAVEVFPDFDLYRVGDPRLRPYEE